MRKVQMYTVLDLVSRIRTWKERFKGYLVGIFDMLTSVWLIRRRVTENTLAPLCLTMCTRMPTPTSNLSDSTTLASLRGPSRGELGVCVVATDMTSQSVTTKGEYLDRSQTVFRRVRNHTFEQMCGDRTGTGGQGPGAGLHGDGDALSAGNSNCSQGIGI